MSHIGIDRDVLTALAQNEGLPKLFVSDILKSLTECDLGMLVPYMFSNGNSAGRDPRSSEEPLVLSSHDSDSRQNPLMNAFFCLPLLFT